MPMFLGYNTNGLAHHEPADAIALLAELGYRGIGLTIDHGLLSPRDPQWRRQAEQLRGLLAAASMRSVIETGARYLLDYRQKHEPTLVSPDAHRRQQRVEFLCHAIDAAVAMGSDCISCWSGIAHDRPPADEGFRRLVEGLRAVLDYAAERNVIVAFEPEPGMWIARMDDFAELRQRIDAPHLRLTLDIGHLHCQDETPLADMIVRWGALLANVHLEDMRRGVHEHLMFGEGEIDLPPVIQALARAGYDGGIYIELSRHSHDGPRVARRSLELLQPLLDQVAHSR